jgi:hypothetical protein
MKDSIVRQLKALKDERAGGSPDARWLASTKETLMMQIGNTVSSERRTGLRAFAQNLRVFLPENMMRAMMVPALMLVLIVSAGFSSMAVVASAHGTLPGDVLYGVKLAAEAVSLRFAPKVERTERRVEIAGRRLDEMARLSASAEPDKEAKIAKVAALFSDEMNSIRKDLSDLQKEEDNDEIVRVAVRVDAKADEYQALFKSGLSVGRPTLRMALLNLDQVSVKALEILVEKQSLASNVLPEAQLTSSVGKRIDSFAAHVAAAQDNYNGETFAPQSLLLTAKARVAVEEAKELLSQGDFRAAVRKVSESAELVSEAETIKDEPVDTTVSSTETSEVDSATTAP